MASSILFGFGISCPSRSAVFENSITVSFLPPRFPSAIFSERAFFFAPEPIRAPPLFVPSFANEHTSFRTRGLFPCLILRFFTRSSSPLSIYFHFRDFTSPTDHHSLQ